MIFYCIHTLSFLWEAMDAKPFSIYYFNALTSFHYSAKIPEVRLLSFVCIFGGGQQAALHSEKGMMYGPVRAEKIWEDHPMSFNFDRRTFLKGAGAVGAASLLAACGGKSDNGSGAAASTSGAEAPNTTGATPLKEFISFESGNRELESWNMLYTQKAEDANVITNLWDGLLSFDCYGKVAPAIASSWEHNDDSTVWTFHLRDDVDWVDANG